MNETIAILQSFFSIELTKSGHNSITVGKLILALTLFALGFLIARRVSRFLVRKVLQRFRLDHGIKDNLEKLSFYILMILVVGLALNFADVPLTLFTVLGGAVAIVVGFGTQNLLNNFISGLILMMERPIRVDDIIEVDEVIGVVQYIGARCTQVKTPNGVEILIPNSHFLEKKVVNRTLSDNQMRLSVRVGVAYGCDVGKVKEILLKVAGEHPLVLKRPEPLVTFSDFGEKALIFDLFFWVDLKLAIPPVESDLRFRIDQLFRDQKIQMPLPQAFQMISSS